MLLLRISVLFREKVHNDPHCLALTSITGWAAGKKLDFGKDGKDGVCGGSAFAMVKHNH